MGEEKQRLKCFHSQEPKQPSPHLQTIIHLPQFCISCYYHRDAPWCHVWWCCSSHVEESSNLLLKYWQTTLENVCNWLLECIAKKYDSYLHLTDTVHINDEWCLDLVTDTTFCWLSNCGCTKIPKAKKACKVTDFFFQLQFHFQNTAVD